MHTAPAYPPGNSSREVINVDDSDPDDVEFCGFKIDQEKSPLLSRELQEDGLTYTGQVCVIPCVHGVPGI